jgi:hypothetical protein
VAASATRSAWAVGLLTLTAVLTAAGYLTKLPGSAGQSAE